jgi:hypothetical protein
MAEASTPSTTSKRPIGALTVLAAAVAAGAIALFGVRLLGPRRAEAARHEIAATSPTTFAPGAAQTPTSPPSLQAQVQGTGQAQAFASTGSPPTSMCPQAPAPSPCPQAAAPSPCPQACPITQGPVALPALREEDLLAQTAAAMAHQHQQLPYASSTVPTVQLPTGAAAPRAAEAATASYVPMPQPASLQAAMPMFGAMAGAANAAPQPTCPAAAPPPVAAPGCPAAAAAVPAPQPPAPAPEPFGLTLADVAQEPAALEMGILSLGAAVKRVAPGSLAQQVGLREGDRVISVAGQPVVSVFHFFYLLSTQASDRPVKVAVARQGRPVQLDWPPAGAVR